MSTTVKTRKIIHQKLQEAVVPTITASALGSFVASDKYGILPNQPSFYVASNAVAYMQSAQQNMAPVQLPASGIAGSSGSNAGMCGEFHPLSAPAGNITNTATAGTNSSMTTALNITRNLAGHRIVVVAGTGSGYDGTIAYNTIGASAIITVVTPNGVAFDNTTQYRIYGGSLWYMNAGTVAVGFSVYDVITNTWTARSVTNLPTLWGTDAQLSTTPSAYSNGGLGFVNGTATAATSTTLSDSTKTLPVNGFANVYQIRIKSGTGAGQIREIVSNTASQFTVATWTVTPDATSVYVIEGNDDVMFLMGNAAVTLYKFRISTNAWVVLSPTAARSGAPGAGNSFSWIPNVKTDSKWSDETYTTSLAGVTRQNGRNFYSFRGTANAVCDVYDGALNTWISNISYGNSTTTFTSGTHSTEIDGHIYIQKELTNYVYRFDIAENRLEPYFYWYVSQGAVLVGNRIWLIQFVDGSTRLTYLYSMLHTSTQIVRVLDI